MNRFTPVLKRMSGRLTVPQPLKSRILFEMAGDLEELFAFYRSKGLSEQDAVRKAEEKIEAGDETIELLTHMNDTAVKRFMRRFSEPNRKRIEIFSWVLLMLSTGLFGFMKLMGSRLLSGSVFTWLLLAVAVFLCGLFLSKYYMLYIKKDHALPGLRTGLPLMLFLGMQSVLIGLNGFFYELYTASVTMATEIDMTYEFFTNALMRCFGLLSFGFVIAVVAALMWFVFTLKTLSVEQYEKSVLYLD